MPSVHLVLPLRTPIHAITSLHNSLCSHRLKRLEKANRRVKKKRLVAMNYESEGMVDFVDVKNDLELKLPSIAREQYDCGPCAEDDVSELRCAFDVALQIDDVKNVNADESQGANGCGDVTMNVMASEHVTAANSEGNLQENFSTIHAMPLTVPRKLISAMKGSRVKEGLPLKKLSVSWDPEVYDPLPSSVSHLPKRNNLSHRNNKKHSKGKQKNKNSQGTRKKDKKHHHRKVSEKGEPSMGLAFSMEPVLATDSETIVSSNYKATIEHSDFENGDDNPDSNCGSSFLRRSCGNLHYTYAEAT